LVIHLRSDNNKEGLSFMAEAVDQARQEFWRPPMPTSLAPAGSERAATCSCGTEFIVSSLYCHACGAERAELNPIHSFEIPGWTELVAVGGRLGLNPPATIAFLVGMLCLAGAVAVSLFFSARTALDWQAIQLWRIEWLVAAIAAFGAGCVLKK
jgi:hypothetical protein